MSKRTDMLATEVRSLIAPALRMCPQECGIVSIVTVQISADAGYADIGITALMHPEKALEYLKNKKHELQGELSKLERKVIPRLRFYIETSHEQGDRVSDLLRRLEDTNDKKD